MSKKKDESIYYCVGCGKVHSKGSFYISYSKNHANGTLFYCKNFIKKKSYEGSTRDVNLDGFQRMLRQLDLPYLDELLVSSAEENSNDPVGIYFRMINTLPQYRGLTWSNSIFANEPQHSKGSSTEDDIIEYKIDMRQAISRWGKEYNKEQLVELEKFYIKMENANRIETPQHKFYLEKLAIISMKMNEELKAGNYAQVKQLGDLFSKYMADSQFRAIDKTDADRQGGIRTFSAIYEEVEKDGHIPPWEKYRKIKGLSQDVLDKTIMHIENFTLRFNKAEVMVAPPRDTPQASVDELDDTMVEGEL